MSETGGPEHDFEPVPGLPGQLPVGERIVWQGTPHWRVVLRQNMKARWVAFYFLAIMVFVIWRGVETGRPLFDALVGLGILAAASLFVLGFMAVFAWGVQKTTLYTITNRRVVMRVGVALSATYNLPFRLIENIDMRIDGRGRGEIALRLQSKGVRLAYMTLWPHARGWRFRQVEPRLTGLEDARSVSNLLAEQVLAFIARNHEAAADVSVPDVGVVATAGVAKPAASASTAAATAVPAE